MSKFGEISHREVVATSGGDLPVHYILHAAATRLNKDGTSSIGSDDILATSAVCFQLARQLGVTTTFWPLLGAGTEGLKRDQSLTGMLRALAATAAGDALPLEMVIVIRDESAIEPSTIIACIQAELAGWLLEPTPADKDPRPSVKEVPAAPARLAATEPNL